MKRIALILLCLLVAFSFAACKDNSLVYDALDDLVAQGTSDNSTDNADASNSTAPNSNANANTDNNSTPNNDDNNSTPNNDDNSTPNNDDNNDSNLTPNPDDTNDDNNSTPNNDDNNDDGGSQSQFLGVTDPLPTDIAIDKDIATYSVIYGDVDTAVAEIANTVNQPRPKEGWVVKVEGTCYFKFFAANNVKHYRLVLFDSSACCSEEFEIVFAEDYPAPPDGTTILLIGRLTVVEIDGVDYCYLADSVYTIDY